MALNIETFSNAKGGNAFFKAIGHPLAAREAKKLLDQLGEGAIAVYDPLGYARAFAEIYDLSALDIAAVFVQDLEEIGSEVLGKQAQPVTDMAASKVAKVFVTAFDAGRLIAHVKHLLPKGAEVVSLDALRLPDAMLTNRRNYLDSLNFATNLVFFRDSDGHHTRLVTANYWSAYGAKAPQAWCCLLNEKGEALAEWTDALPGANASVVIDSKDVRQRFGLDGFTGSLFLHVCGVAGHDIVRPSSRPSPRSGVTRTCWTSARMRAALPSNSASSPSWGAWLPRICTDSRIRGSACSTSAPRKSRATTP
jgi:hypothetical protein